MTISSSPPDSQNAKKTPGFSGCVVTVLAIIFALLGIYDLLFGSIIAYVFSSAQMWSFTSIVMVLIIACDCFIYFFLAFRIKRQKWFISLAMLALVWLILPFPLRTLINTASMTLRVDGYAMGETLPNGSLILANRQAYQQNDIQRGDIVVFELPSSKSTMLIKRVIGLPNETVAISQDGQVSINGTPISEPYTFAKATYTGEWKVPAGEYFVLGDNRPDSFDSHVWGFVPHENIIAKAVWVYFPFANFGRIDDVVFAP